MIKFHFLPGGGAVAGFTTLPQGTLMRIVLLMAGETVHGRALEQIISMTITAGYIDMPGQQFEYRTVMVKMEGGPTLGRMARGTVHTQCSGMRIIGAMTDGTIQGCILEIRQGMGVNMTGLAGNCGMFTCQFERELVMGKMLTQAVDAIMTIDASHTKRSDVSRHERRVPQTVAGLTDVRIEDRYIRCMAIRADERFFLRLELVRGQHKPRQLMRIFPPIQHSN